MVELGLWAESNVLIGIVKNCSTWVSLYAHMHYDCYVECLRNTRSKWFPH